nr:meiotic recombination protein REC8 homolog [Paramormyrops kingsleyae]
MFYYPTVLHRHTGCFATIWLAATKGVRISRREFLTVNVGRTCVDTMDYILVKPGRPRPRFSLYLSSQLQYGIIVIYHRQCAFFLGETHAKGICSQCLILFGCSRIHKPCKRIIVPPGISEEVHRALERLRECLPVSASGPVATRLAVTVLVSLTLPLCSTSHAPHRSDLTFPDPLLLLEEAEGALDPFFGVMGVERTLPSPNHLAQLRQYETSSSTLCPPVTSHKTTPEQGGGVLSHPGGRVGRGGASRGLGQRDRAADGAEGCLFARAGGVERMARQEATREPSPAQISMERDKDTAVEDSMWITDEIMGLPVEVQLGSVPTELTPPLTEAPAMSPRGHRELGAEPQRGVCQSIEPHMNPPGDRQGRRRQLLFIDPGVQISHDAMQAQIADPLVETVSMSQVLAEHPSHHQVAPKELLLTPCTMQLLDDADAFWKKHAALAIFPGDGWVRKGAGLDIGAETELVLQEPIEEMTRDDCSVREVPRELRESGLTASEVSALTEVRLEESRGEWSRGEWSRGEWSRGEWSREEWSREERSREEWSREEWSREERSREERSRGERSREERSREEWSREERSREEWSRGERSREGRAHESVSPSDRWSAILETPPNLEGIPEEMVELPEAEAKWGEVTTESVLRMAAHHFNHYGHMFFHSLLPPEATRSTAAHIFSRLLGEIGDCVFFPVVAPQISTVIQMVHKLII